MKAQSEAKWTEGPWRTYPSECGQEVIKPTRPGWSSKLIASCTSSSFDAATCEANARLIAQAPAMLEALEACLEMPVMSFAERESLLERIQEIIARAKGKKP